MIPEAPKSDIINGKTIIITAENKYASESAKKFYNAYYLPLDKIRNWIEDDTGLRRVWLQATYGVTGDDKGGVLGGALDQLFDIPGAAKEVLNCIWELLKNPKNTLDTVWFLSKVLNPSPLLFVDEKIKFFNLVKEMVATLIEEFKNADSYEKGRMIGKAISFVLSFLVSGVGIVKALGILDLLRESKVLSAVCTKVAKGTVASKEALAKTLEAAGTAINKFKTVSSDFLNSISGSIIKFADRYAFKPTYAGVDDELIYISRSDITGDINKIDSIASDAGRLVDEGCEVASGTSKVISIIERILQYDRIKYNSSLSKAYSAGTKHSDILRAELYAGGVTAPPYGTAAHHIVAWDADIASTARNILSKYDINVDSAANGVLLPFERNSYVTTEAMHNGGHLNSYFEAVNTRLKDVEYLINRRGLDSTTARMLICEELQNIRSDLLNGLLKIHN
jgi:hypothetical protein